MFKNKCAFECLCTQQKKKITDNLTIKKRLHLFQTLNLSLRFIIHHRAILSLGKEIKCKTSLSDLCSESLLPEAFFSLSLSLRKGDHYWNSSDETAAKNTCPLIDKSWHDFSSPRFEQWPGCWQEPNSCSSYICNVNEVRSKWVECGKDKTEAARADTSDIQTRGLCDWRQVLLLSALLNTMNGWSSRHLFSVCRSRRKSSWQVFLPQLSKWEREIPKWTWLCFPFLKGVLNSSSWNPSRVTNQRGEHQIKANVLLLLLLLAPCKFAVHTNGASAWLSQTAWSHQ